MVHKDVVAAQKKPSRKGAEVKAQAKVKEQSISKDILRTTGIARTTNKYVQCKVKEGEEEEEGKQEESFWH